MKGETEEETPKGEPESIEEAHKDKEDGENAESEERIRGGGKLMVPKGDRDKRRYSPYRNTEDAETPSDVRGRRVYVGNLSWDVSWQDLKDHMKSSGEEVIRADVLTSNGRSKGCGVVEFATVEGAQRAIATLNDTELNGRQIFVREDREEGRSTHAHGGGQSSGSRFSSGEKAQNHRVYVGNLSWDVAWQDLKDHMRQAGEVLHAEVITEASGRSKGCGIVEYATEDEAQEAIGTLTDTELKGRMIFVREDRETGASFHGGSGKLSGTSVYVWNLAYETTWQELKDHMRLAGNVDQATILTGHSGESIGCGVVVYQKPQEAARAIRELQNSDLNGRPIYVREDRMQPGGSRGHGYGHGHGHGRGYSGRTHQSSRGGERGGGHVTGGGGCQLYVGNLSYDTTWQDLKDHFRQCGTVDRVQVMEYPDGKKKGFGTVRFSKEEEAQKAIKRLNGVELQGRDLEVRLDAKAH